MNRRNDGSSIIAVFVVIGFLLLIGWIMDASTAKCIKAGCKNDQSPNSSYCYLHKPYTGHSSYKSKSSSSSTSTSGSSSTGNKSTSSGTTYSGKTSSSNKSYGTSKKSSSYSSYDDGYDAVYDDDDYDDDRYWSDPDYADGVDDAMDELDW